MLSWFLKLFNKQKQMAAEQTTHQENNIQDNTTMIDDNFKQEATNNIKQLFSLLAPPNLEKKVPDLKGWQQLFHQENFFDIAIEGMDIEDEDLCVNEIYQNLMYYCMSEVSQHQLISRVDWKDSESFLHFLIDTAKLWDEEIDWQSAPLQHRNVERHVINPITEEVFNSYGIEELTEWVHDCLQDNPSALRLWFWNDDTDAYNFWLIPIQYEDSICELADTMGLMFTYNDEDYQDEIEEINPAWINAVEELIPLISANKTIANTCLKDFRNCLAEHGNTMDSSQNVLDLLSMRIDGPYVYDAVYNGNGSYADIIEELFKQRKLSSPITEEDMITLHIPELIDKAHQHFTNNGLIYWTINNPDDQGRIFISKQEHKQAIHAIANTLELNFTPTPIQWDEKNLQRFKKREERIKAEFDAMD